MSGESNTALDLLEAELFRDARLELEPDQARVEGLWRSIAAASALAAAVSSVTASIPPASGTGWAAPRPVTVTPSAAPAPSEELAQTGTLLQSSGEVSSAQVSSAQVSSAQVSFGLRALFGAAVGGALLGFAAGYGSAGGAQDALDPPRVATVASSEVSSASNASNANPATAAEAADASPGAASPRADQSQTPTGARGNSVKPQVGRVDALPSSSEQVAESAQPSFYEELQYVKRAQSALRQGNGALALGLMTSLDSIQPGGALLSERGVTQVLAHCQLGDVESATLVAQRLIASGLASVYAERLENSCAGAVLLEP